MLRLGNRRGPSVRLLRTLQYDRKRRIFHCVALRFIYTRSFKLFISIGYCLHSPLYNVYHVACPYGVGEDTISHTRNRTWSSQTLQHTPTYEAQYLSSKAPHTQVGQYLSSKVPHGSEPYLAVTLHPHVYTDRISSSKCGSCLFTISDCLSWRQLRTLMHITNNASTRNMIPENMRNPQRSANPYRTTA